MDIDKLKEKANQLNKEKIEEEQKILEVANIITNKYIDDIDKTLEEKIIIALSNNENKIFFNIDEIDYVEKYYSDIYGDNYKNMLYEEFKTTKETRLPQYKIAEIVKSNVATMLIKKGCYISLSKEISDEYFNSYIYLNKRHYIISKLKYPFYKLTLVSPPLIVLAILFIYLFIYLVCNKVV